MSISFSTLTLAYYDNGNNAGIPITYIESFPDIVFSNEIIGLNSLVRYKLLDYNDTLVTFIILERNLVISISMLKTHEVKIYQLSKTGNSKLWTRFLGILLVGWAMVLLFGLFQDEKPFYWLQTKEAAGIIGIIVFTILLLVTGISFLIAQTKIVKDSTLHEYSSFIKVVESIRFVGIVLIFIIPLSLLVISDSSDNDFRVFGGIILGIFWIVTIFLMVDVYRKFKLYLKFGKSLLVTDKPYYRFGDTLKIKLINKKLQGAGLAFCLRNLYEYWENKGDSENSYVVYKTLCQVNKSGGIDQEIEFEIPLNNHVKPTLYDYNNPYYWSFEVTNQEMGYFSQFIVNVIE